MPTDSARAPAAVSPVPPESRPAYTTPTAMPSGMLWMVTARSMSVLRWRFDLRPSGRVSFSPRWRWGSRLSSSSRNRIPSQKPTNAGTQARRPMADDSSIAGTMRLQTDAATITPAANPVSARSTAWLSRPRMRKTMAAPAVVPASGIARPIIVRVTDASKGTSPLFCVYSSMPAGIGPAEWLPAQILPCAK